MLNDNLYFNIFLLFVLCSFLVYSTNILIVAFSKLSRITHLSKFGLTAFIMALATSLPELIVGVMSAFEGTPTLSLGNVIGSNMSNLSIVIGGAAIVGSGIPVIGSFLRKDLMLGAMVGSVPLFMLIDGSLSRLDGIILIIIYLIFVRTIVYERPEQVLTDDGQIVIPVYARFFAFFRRRAVRHNLRVLIIGLFLLVGSGYLIVETAKNVAVLLRAPILLVGLFLVSIGTTLPELSFSIKAVKSRQVSMIFGNLLGSIAANSTLILGIVAMISPITPTGGIKPYLVGTIGYLILFTLFWIFTSSKSRLSRTEGIILVAVYLAVMSIELFRI